MGSPIHEDKILQSYKTKTTNAQESIEKVAHLAVKLAVVSIAGLI